MYTDKFFATDNRKGFLSSRLKRVISLENIVMITIKHLQMNHIFALNNPKDCDMFLNK